MQEVVDRGREEGRDPVTMGRVSDVGCLAKKR